MLQISIDNNDNNGQMWKDYSYTEQTKDIHKRIFYSIIKHRLRWNMSVKSLVQHVGSIVVFMYDSVLKM